MKIHLPNPFVRTTHDSYLVKNPIKKRAISRLLPSYKKTTYILLPYIFILPKRPGDICSILSYRILSVSYTCLIYDCKGIEYIKNRVILYLPNAILSYKKNVTHTILDTIVPK